MSSATMNTKPILFNTDMVRALLDGRKTVTRRVVKPQPSGQMYPMPEGSSYPGFFGTTSSARVLRPPYQPGDILYVRETWTIVGTDGIHHKYGYKADNERLAPLWCPSIHMPKEAARIFLRVMDVRAERLQGITVTGLQEEGLLKDVDTSQYSVVSSPDLFSEFQQLWDSTIKPADRTLYGWLANPWVWVIEFERIGREEAL